MPIRRRLLWSSCGSGALGGSDDLYRATIFRMAADADASEAARSLAQLRWSPEGRMRAAVNTVAANPELLDETQRAALEAAITPPPGGEGRDQG